MTKRIRNRLHFSESRQRSNTPKVSKLRRFLLDRHSRRRLNICSVRSRQNIDAATKRKIQRVISKKDTSNQRPFAELNPIRTNDIKVEPATFDPEDEYGLVSADDLAASSPFLLPDSRHESTEEFFCDDVPQGCSKAYSGIIAQATKPQFKDDSFNPLTIKYESSPDALENYNGVAERCNESYGACGQSDSIAFSKFPNNGASRYPVGEKHKSDPFFVTCESEFVDGVYDGDVPASESGSFLLLDDESELGGDKTCDLSDLESVRFIVPDCHSEPKRDSKSRKAISKFVVPAIDISRFYGTEWKLVSPLFYSYLVERCASESPPTASFSLKRKKRVKKLTCRPTTKRFKTEPNIWDPYSMQSNSQMNLEAISDTVAEKTAILLHLGVKRAVFPQVYQNIRAHCGMFDGEMLISEPWAEFALSTLIRPDEPRIKSIVLPVVDSKLLLDVKDFSGANGIGFHKITVAEKSTEAKSYPKVESARSLIKQEITADFDTSMMNEVKVEDTTMETDSNQDRSFSTSKNLLANSYNSSKSYTARKGVDRDYCDINSQQACRSPIVASVPTIDWKRIARDKGFRPCAVVLERLKLEPNRTSFRIRECSPRTSISLLNLLSSKTSMQQFLLANASKKLSAIPEHNPSKSDLFVSRKLAPEAESIKSIPSAVVKKTPVETDGVVISKHNFFGTLCSRVYGIMIDYSSRNKSPVYLFKMRKSLSSQRKFNKYFQNCVYGRLCQDDDNETDLIDVEQVQQQENKFQLVDQSFSSNPLNVFNISLKSKIFGMHQMFDPNAVSHYTSQIHRVNLQEVNISGNVKWILLELSCDVEKITFRSNVKYPANLLFEVIYRADLSKSIVRMVCNQFDSRALQHFGIYGVPGLSRGVIIGPISIRERAPLLEVTLKKEDNVLETHDVPILTALSPNLRSVDHGVVARWWRPGTSDSFINSVTDQFLNFCFKQQDLAYIDDYTPPSKQYLRLTYLMQAHNALCYVRCRENNFVLIHDANEEYLNSQIWIENNHENSKRPSLEHIKKARLSHYNRRSRLLSNLADSEEKRTAEQIRRKEFRNNRIYLSQVLNIDPNVVCLNTTVKKAINEIQLLENERKRLENQLQQLNELKRKTGSKIQTLLNKMDKRTSIFKSTKAAVSKIMNWESNSLQKRQAYKIVTNHSSIEGPKSLSRKLPESVESKIIRQQPNVNKGAKIIQVRKIQNSARETTESLPTDLDDLFEPYEKELESDTFNYCKNDNASSARKRSSKTQKNNSTILPELLDHEYSMSLSSGKNCKKEEQIFRFFLLEYGRNVYTMVGRQVTGHTKLNPRRVMLNLVKQLLENIKNYSELNDSKADAYYLRVSEAMLDPSKCLSTVKQWDDNSPRYQGSAVTTLESQNKRYMCRIVRCNSGNDDNISLNQQNMRYVYGIDSTKEIEESCYIDNVLPIIDCDGEPFMQNIIDDLNQPKVRHMPGILRRIRLPRVSNFELELPTGSYPTSSGDLLLGSSKFRMGPVINGHLSLSKGHKIKPLTSDLLSFLKYSSSHKQLVVRGGSSSSVNASRSFESLTKGVSVPDSKSSLLRLVHKLKSTTPLESTATTAGASKNLLTVPKLKPTLASILKSIPKLKDDTVCDRDKSQGALENR